MRVLWKRLDTFHQNKIFSIHLTQTELTSSSNLYAPTIRHPLSDTMKSTRDGKLVLATLDEIIITNKKLVYSQKPFDLEILSQVRKESTYLTEAVIATWKRAVVSLAQFIVWMKRDRRVCFYARKYRLDNREIQHAYSLICGATGGVSTSRVSSRLQSWYKMEKSPQWAQLFLVPTCHSQASSGKRDASPKSQSQRILEDFLNERDQATIRSTWNTAKTNGNIGPKTFLR